MSFQNNRFSEKELEKIKNCLREQSVRCGRQFLNFKQSLATHQEHKEHRSEDLGGCTDSGAAAFNQHVEVGISKVYSDLVYQIDRALVAIDARTYGICENCELPIGDRRLKAIPWATKCIDCETGRTPQLRN